LYRIFIGISLFSHEKHRKQEILFVPMGPYTAISEELKLCTGWARGLEMDGCFWASKPSPRREVQMPESGCSRKNQSRVAYSCCGRRRHKPEDSGEIPPPPSPGSDAAAAVGHDPLPPSHGHPWPSAFSPLFAISSPPGPRRTSRQGRRRQGLLLSITGLFLRFADGGFRQEDGGRQPRCHLLQVMVLVRLVAPTEPNLALIH
jgi:hypothetical protein